MEVREVKVQVKVHPAGRMIEEEDSQEERGSKGRLVVDQNVSVVTRPGTGRGNAQSKMAGARTPIVSSVEKEVILLGIVLELPRQPHLSKMLEIRI